MKRGILALAITCLLAAPMAAIAETPTRVEQLESRVRQLAAEVERLQRELDRTRLRLTPPLTTVVYEVGDLAVLRHGNGMQAEFDALIGAIESKVAPAAWERNNGPGKITPFATNFSLVVCTTDEVHLQVAQYLDRLRKARQELESAGYEVTLPSDRGAAESVDE